MGRGRTRWLFLSMLGFGLVVLPSLPAVAQNQGLVVRDGTLGSEPPGVVPPGLDDLGEHADYLIPAPTSARSGVGISSTASGASRSEAGSGRPSPVRGLRIPARSTT